MTTRVMWRVGAWVAAGGIALAISAFAPIAPATAPAVPRRPPPLPAVPRPYSSDSLARAAAARDVFRAARRPAAIAYDPQRAAAPVEAKQPPKPVLALIGLVGGDKATAVIEGLPGIEGARVVRVGDVVSGIRVMRIGADHVRLVGMDTVWVLRVREPWKP